MPITLQTGAAVHNGAFSRALACVLHELYTTYMYTVLHGILGPHLHRPIYMAIVKSVNIIIHVIHEYEPNVPSPRSRTANRK